MPDQVPKSTAAPVVDEATAHTAELDAIADAAIAARAARMAENKPEDAPGQAGDPAAEAPADPLPDAPDAQVTPPAPAAPEAPPEDPALATRLEILARKTQEAEATLARKTGETEARLAQARPVLAVLERLGPDAARLLEVAQKLGSLEQMAKSDPLGLMLALGADTSLVAYQAMQAQIGDKAPANVQARIAQHKAEQGQQTAAQKIAALEARLDEMAQSQQVERARDTYRASLAADLAAANSGDVPLVKALLSDEKVAPRVVQQLLDVQEAHARATGAFLPVTQLIAEFEDELAKEYTADYVAYLRSKHSTAPPAASPAGTRPTTAASHAAPHTGITNRVAGSTQPPQPRVPEKPESRAELVAEAKQYLEERARA